MSVVTLKARIGDVITIKLVEPEPEAVAPLVAGDQGVDLSRHNEDPAANRYIDFDQVRASGRRVCILRGTLGAPTSLYSGRDDRFASFWPRAVAAKFDYLGVYHLFIKESAWQAQLENILTFNGGDRGNYPLTIDLEPRGGEVVPNLTSVLVNLRPLLEGLWNKLGYPPIIYTAVWAISAFFLGGQDWLAEYPLHAASYPRLKSPLSKPAVPDPWKRLGKRWFAWQYSSTGKVPGVPGSTDLNEWSGEAIPPVG